MVISSQRPAAGTAATPATAPADAAAVFVTATGCMLQTAVAATANNTAATSVGVEHISATLLGTVTSGARVRGCSPTKMDPFHARVLRDDDDSEWLRNFMTGILTPETHG
ncbi:unnamed protein product [Macrosiphum euphorbiae]|uniref:Uncharacterized protein n=1 Tax=Macrosiphum euphorbiae TaxID=13131 RepID=A0AAV0X9B3_9HEMI|nr:unnamed protein product [Macrosiphum euphorbiae]